MKKWTNAQLIGGMIAFVFVVIISVCVNLLMPSNQMMGIDNPPTQSGAYKGNMRYFGQWDEDTKYAVDLKAELPVVQYHSNLYIANYVVKQGVPPNQSEHWTKISGSGVGGIDEEARFEIKAIKETTKFNDPVPITLAKAKIELNDHSNDITALQEAIGKKADANNVINAITVEGKDPLKGIVDLKAGNVNMEIAEDGQSIKFSPKGQAGGVTSLFGMTGDIGLKSSDGSVTYTKDGTDIDTKAKGGSGGVTSWFGMTGAIEVVSADGTIELSKDGQKVDMKAKGGGDGVVSINGLKGVVVMDSPKKTITYNNNGQTIEMEAKGGGGKVDDTDVTCTVAELECANQKEVNEKVYNKLFKPNGFRSQHVYNSSDWTGDTLLDALNDAVSTNIHNRSKVDNQSGTVTSALNTLNDRLEKIENKE